MKRRPYIEITFPRTFMGVTVFALFWLASLFVFLLIQALLFRFAITWGIDILSWWREVLNNLAGAVGA